MGITTLWLFVSHAFLVGIGVSLLRADILALGLVFAVVLPALRLVRRFSENGGYRLIGDAGKHWGTLADRGGRVTRATEPLYFKMCVGLELFVLAALLVLMLLPRSV